MPVLVPVSMNKGSSHTTYHCRAAHSAAIRNGALKIQRPAMILASVQEGKISNKNTVGNGRRNARKVCKRIEGKCESRSY